MGTPREKVVVRAVSPGSYYHFVIRKGLLAILRSMKIINLNDPVGIFIGIDGLPLA